MPDLDAAGRLQDARAVELERVAARTSAASIVARRGEVAADHEVDDVMVGLVGAGRPRRPGDDPGVDEEAAPFAASAPGPM